MEPDVSLITRDIAARICRREGGDPTRLMACGRPEWAGYIGHARDAQAVVVETGLVTAEQFERWQAATEIAP